MPLLTPSRVRALLAEYGIRPSRALGQHFLADPNTARRIVRLAGVGAGDRVLEIGPGLGSLTLALLERGASVLALEHDRRLLGALAAVLAGDDRARVRHSDATRDDIDALLDDGSWCCVSNLPYNVAGHVVLRLLDTVPRLEELLVMVQREVGERLVAPPGTRAYGAVSVKVAYHARGQVVGRVARTVFIPEPQVDSALVRISRREEPAVDVPSRERLFTLVGAGFAQRRKMLRRALEPLLGERTNTVLQAAGVDPSARAETLELEAWSALAHADART